MEIGGCSAVYGIRFLRSDRRILRNLRADTPQRGTGMAHCYFPNPGNAGAISALFNWYAMRRGTLLVGTEGRAFATDLHRLPVLIVSFLAVLPLKLLERLKRAQSGFLRGGKRGEFL